MLTGPKPRAPNSRQLLSKIQGWAQALGFAEIRVAGVDLSSAEAGLSAWLARGFHGEMAYMAQHGMKRARPAELVPGTVSVITARMDYLPRHAPADWLAQEWARLHNPAAAAVALYARGRDYHKVLRRRLQRLAQQLRAEVAPLGFRVFTDSAPVLEVELAARSGLGWRGKNTLLLHRQGGSLFFLGEIFLDLALPESEPVSPHCGSCQACLRACPTQAIVAPYQLDARRCISYLTIEHPGAIPLALRPLMGNRIYGCDDCQWVCPWNKFAKRSALPDFDERQDWRGAGLTALFNWTEPMFCSRTAGSPIRRIGYQRWQRNVAVAMGNALRAPAQRGLAVEPAAQMRAALQQRLPSASALVAEHIAWALEAPA